MSLSSRFYSEVKKARLPDAATDNDAEISPEDPDLDTQEADAIIANYAINLKDFEDEEDQIVKGGPGSGPAEGGGGSSTQAKIVEAKAREEKARIHRDSLRGAARDQANAEMRMAQQDKQSLMDRSRYESHQSMNKSENDSSSDVKKNDLEPKKIL